MSQSIDRVQVCRLEGGEKPEDDADDHGKHHGNNDGRHADGNRSRRHARYDCCKTDTGTHAHNAAKACQHSGFR